MSTRINLQGPYSEIYRIGYLRESRDNRKRLDLFNSNDDRTTISYAKYLMTVEIGELIPEGYDIDHVDGDKTNDHISNLQILLRKDHHKKTGLEFSGRTMINLICPNCGRQFERELRQTHYKKNNKRTFCSRKCNGQFKEIP